MQNVAKLQGGSLVLRDRACSRWAKEGTTPFGTISKVLQSQGILALDTGAPLHGREELGKEAKIWLLTGVAPSLPWDRACCFAGTTHSRDEVLFCMSGQWTPRNGVVNDYSEPSMVLHTLLCPHKTCLTILPLAGRLTQAARGLCVPAWHRQQPGEPARGQGVAAPKDPVLMDLEFPRSGSHCEQEKHSQGRAMGKGPPAQHSQPQPLPHSPAWHPRLFTQGHGCIAPEERCCTEAGLSKLPNLLEGVFSAMRMPGYVGRGEG